MNPANHSEPDRENGRVDDFPPYPSGLMLSGRRVVVAGGGHVAQRRVPALLAAGAVVTVVSPTVTPAIEGLVGAEQVHRVLRRWLRECEGPQVPIGPRVFARPENVREFARRDRLAEEEVPVPEGSLPDETM